MAKIYHDFLCSMQKYDKPHPSHTYICHMRDCAPNHSSYVWYGRIGVTLSCRCTHFLVKLCSCRSGNGHHYTGLSDSTLQYLVVANTLPPTLSCTQSCLDAASAVGSEEVLRTAKSMGSDHFFSGNLSRTGIGSGVEEVLMQWVESASGWGELSE